MTLKKSKFLFLLNCILVLFSYNSLAQKNYKKPNIIFILTDDMGYGDISSYYGTYKTPNIDRLASEGIKFDKFYAAAPICSPSRVSYLTGMTAQRWDINTYLSWKEHNQSSNQADFLNPKAPTIAKALKSNGYKTAHIGKWHMGGGRDVTDAPGFANYGFDTWYSTYESPQPDPLLTSVDWIWSDTDSIKRWNRTAYFVDRTLEFLKQNKSEPCFVNLWPDDVHDPWIAADENNQIFPGGHLEEKSFLNVLKEFDKQVGRLMDGIKELGIADNTIIIFTSDNGPLPNFRNDRSAGLKGGKLSLYEGGINVPFIISGPNIPKGKIDSTSVISACDMYLSLSALTKTKVAKGYISDGEDKSKVLLGKPELRKTPLFWEYGGLASSYKYGGKKNRSPFLAVREKDWKLLMNFDGGNKQLYNLANDRNETNNVALQNPAIVDKLSKKLLDWKKSID